jgi:hypothetical protein
VERFEEQQYGQQQLEQHGGQQQPSHGRGECHSSHGQQQQQQQHCQQWQEEPQQQEQQQQQQFVPLDLPSTSRGLLGDSTCRHQVQQQGGAKHWTCQVCTFAANPLRLLRCEVCDTPKVGPSSYQQQQAKHKQQQLAAGVPGKGKRVFQQQHVQVGRLKGRGGSSSSSSRKMSGGAQQQLHLLAWAAGGGGGGGNGQGRPPAAAVAVAAARVGAAAIAKAMSGNAAASARSMDTGKREGSASATAAAAGARKGSGHGSNVGQQLPCSMSWLSKPESQGVVISLIDDVVEGSEASEDGNQGQQQEQQEVPAHAASLLLKELQDWQQQHRLEDSSCWQKR